MKPFSHSIALAAAALLASALFLGCGGDSHAYSGGSGKTDLYSVRCVKD